MTVRGSFWSVPALLIVFAAAGCGFDPEPDRNDPEVEALLGANRNFDRMHPPTPCPAPTTVSLEIKKVRALDAAGVWHVASTARQTVQLYPGVNLAGPLGLATLPPGQYVAVLLRVDDGSVAVGAQNDDLDVIGNHLLIQGEFFVEAGHPISFVPRLDPATDLRCFSKRVCDKHDHGDFDDDHDRSDCRRRGHEPNRPHRRCHHERRWILRPVLTVAPPSFPPPGPGNVPPVTPTGAEVFPACGPDMTIIRSPIINPDEIIAIIPAEPRPGCFPTTFCQVTVDATGREIFTQLPPTPVFSAALPIPVGARTQGCPAEPATPECPILGFNNQRAVGCEAFAANPDCVTITQCPDPGSWDDPNNPDVQDTFEGTNTETPPTVIHTTASDIQDFLTGPNPFYINPCEWNDVLDSTDLQIDVRGIGKQPGAGVGGRVAHCSDNIECLSRNCQGGDPANLLGRCAAAPPAESLKFHYLRGSTSWNVLFDAGMSEALVKLHRPVFFPSSGFDADVVTDVNFQAEAFNQTIPIYGLHIESRLGECEYSFHWNTERNGQAWEVIDGAIRLDPAATFSPGDLTELDADSNAAARQTCLLRLVDLRDAEVAVNQAFHNALIASTFYALAGPNGQVVTSANVVQGFINTYAQAGAAYQTAVAAFDAAQTQALDHAVDGQLLDPLGHVDLPGFTVHRSYGIGPFTVTVELGAYGNIDIGGARMSNNAKTHFLTLPETDPCIGQDCFEIGLSATAHPLANAQLRGYLAAGVDLGVASARAGVRGTLNLADVSLPLAAGFKLRRTTLTPAQFAMVAPDLPPALRAIMSDPMTANFGFMVLPLLGQYVAPYSIGGDLRHGSDAAVRATFLSGSINLFAEVSALGETERWNKRLASWRGIEKEWKIGDGDAGNAIPFSTFGGLFVIPNMVLLPNIIVPPVFGNMNPMDASTAVNDELDTQVTLNDRPYRAHREEKLNMGWVRMTPSTRCETAGQM